MFLILIFYCFLLVSCKLERTKDYPSVIIQFSEAHSILSCKDCHPGDKKVIEIEETERLCSRCHPKEVEAFRSTLHYTYAKELKEIKRVFKLPLDGVKELKELAFLEGDPFKKEGLVIDFLKRRCLSCHIWSRGEEYPATKREKGCFSCHKPHQLSKPDDNICLSCHYSTRIGWDYYGFFPHPWFIDYRSPFVDGKEPVRPYGIEAYELKEDLHKELGFTCRDCHKKEEIMLGKEKSQCSFCHKAFKNRIFHSQRVLGKVRCEVCHSQFMATEEKKICFLMFNPDLEEWSELLVQESFEIEKKILDYLQGKKVTFTIKDKFTEKEKKGLWLCRIGDRFFDKLILGRDQAHRICILRREEILLKFGEREVLGEFKVCKTPHSIGRGDLNRSLKILKELK